MTSRSLLRRNILANFSGQAWAALLNLAVVPVYLKLLGTAGFGLVGFFASVQAIFGVLDLGLSTSANREIARAANAPETIREAPIILRTLEFIYFAAALVIGGALALLAPYVASDWLPHGSISDAALAAAFRVVALTAACRWPVALYTGALRGLEVHTRLNVVSSTAATLRHVGTALALWLWAPTIATFVTFQLVAAVTELLLFRFTAWYTVAKRAPGAPVRFERQTLVRLWRFSANLSLIAMCAAAMKQLDKIIIARMLSLEELGYYTVASTISNSLFLLYSPVFGGVFPRFTALTATSDVSALARVYHRASKTVACVTAPVAALLIFFPQDILFAWTRSTAVALNSHVVLTVLAIAALLNATTQIPYALQLAAGLTWLPLWNNGIWLFLTIPIMIVSVRAFGVVGGGIAWLVFNASYSVTVPYIMHRHVLRREWTRWAVHDNLSFIVAAVGCFGVVATIRAGIAGAPGWPDVILILLALIGYLGLVSPFASSVLRRPSRDPKEPALSA